VREVAIGGEHMSEWSGQSKQIAAVTLFVEDLDVAKSFYEEVFDLPVHYEDANSAVFQFTHTLLNLLKVTQASDLIGPAAVAGRDAGSRFQFTIAVDDVDAVCEQLKDRGVTLVNGPVDRWWGLRTASFTDPDGHIWEIAQDLA
jgi:catechol 2,3-dioxygenase-like lactoylglutathione lyase family enzyme